MLHRMKLRVLYRDQLVKEKALARKRLRVVLLAGLITYPPFLGITYLIFSEARVLPLVLIGLLTCVVCMPIALTGYAKGFGQDLSILWRQRREELLWLAFKVGFCYAFVLYWMILGIVEFLLGYHAFRAMLISFVASAVARDGFEIGHLRAQQADTRAIHTFPDGRPISELLVARPRETFGLVAAATVLAGGLGLWLGPLVINPRYQTLWVAVVAGVSATALYAYAYPPHRVSSVLRRFFIWPGIVLSATYFVVLAYLLRVVGETKLPPSLDFGLLMAVCTAWMGLSSLFLGFLQKGTIGGHR